MRWLKWPVLVALLLGTCLPRFNLRDPGGIKHFTASATATRYGLPLDVEGYRRLSEYFRGSAPSDSLIPPFCYRVLVPFAASRLPWDSLTSINVVDVVCMLLTLVVLDKLLRRSGFNDRGRFLGCLLYAVSFPTFYYGTIGFVDPAVVLVVAAATYAVMSQRLVLFAAILIAGVLVKETNAILAVLPLGWAWAQGHVSKKDVLRLLVFAAVGGLTALSIRVLAPFPERAWFWIPRIGAIGENLSRPRAWLSFIMTLGVPGALAIVGMMTGRSESVLGSPLFRYFLIGAGAAALLYVISVVTAYADGRIVWIIDPFIIPLAVALFPNTHQTAAPG